MPSITDIAEEYVERATALAPFYPGIAGHEHELADLSVDGFAERAELDRSTVADLDASETTGLREQVARARDAGAAGAGGGALRRGGHHQRAQRDLQLGAMGA
jgi:hypothetical protein